MTDLTKTALAPPTRPAHFGPPDSLRTIWTRPRATVRWVLDHGDGGLSVALLAGAIAAWMIHRAAFAPLLFGLERTPLLLVPALVVEAGLAFVVLALVVTGSGRVLGGVSGLRDVARALAWSGAPVAASAPFVALAALLGGEPTWLLLLPYALWLWSLGLAVFAIAEAHRFPVARAMVVLVLGMGTAALAHGALVLALALLLAPGPPM